MHFLGSKNWCLERARVSKKEGISTSFLQGGRNWDNDIDPDKRFELLVG